MGGKTKKSEITFGKLILMAHQTFRRSIPILSFGLAHNFQLILGLELLLNSSITQIQTLVLKRWVEILTIHLMRYVEES